MGEYTYSVNFGYNNHPNNPGATLNFNITILSEFWTPPEPEPEVPEESEDGEPEEPGEPQEEVIEEELINEEISLSEEIT